MSIRRAGGVTIVELIMAMVILGIAAAGIIGVFNLSGSSGVDPLRRKQALMVAEALMEELQQARFTLCDPADAKAAEANTVADCSPNAAVVVGPRAAGATRPYPNLAQYVTALNTPQYSFAKTINGTEVDVDVNGNVLGMTGNAALGRIRTTVEMRLIATTAAASNKLGPAGRQIDSTAADLRVLRVIVRSSYGTGANETVQLEGYRTRYAPRAVP
jgi:MSHA pilin protein MshD